MGSVPPRPLVVADQPELLDDLLRLAAAGSTEVEVVSDPIAARGSWATAPLIVVGVSSGRGCVQARLPRRPGVVLVAPASPGERSEPDDSVWKLAHDLGADHVVCLPDAEPWLIDRFADAVTGSAAAARVVGVVGGRGGAGASVLSAALAVTAARQGLRALLVDVDPIGGGLDLVLGREESPGLRWPDLAAVTGRVSPPVLFDALPRMGELCLLSWDRGDLLTVPPEAVETAIDAGRRGSDLVVLDLPRQPDEGALHAMQAADTVLLVVPAEVRACAAARRVVAAIRPHCSRLQCVVRGRSPAGLRARDVAEALALPLAATVRAEPGLAAALERGEAPAGRGRGPLADACRQILADLAALPKVA